MRLRRAGLLLLSCLLVTGPAPAQSLDSEAVSPQSQQSTQRLERAGGVADTSDARFVRAGPDRSNDGRRANLASVLFVFLSIAVVFEAAMSAIFDWRVFIRRFQGKGVKTLVLVGTALVVSFTYDLDILHQILEALGRPRPEHEIGKVITALLISGGSSAVFRVYSNLGIRSPAERRRKAREERGTTTDAEAPDSSADPQS